MQSQTALCTIVHHAVKMVIVCIFLCCNIVAGDVVEEDDIHLILEYKKGEKWGKYEAPRSNR